MSRASLFERGFVLGQLHAAGQTITTAMIRQRFKVSPATAKRDLRDLRAILADAPRPRRNTTPQPIAVPPRKARLVVFGVAMA